MPIVFLSDPRLYTDFAYYQKRFSWKEDNPNSRLLIYRNYSRVSRNLVSSGRQ